MQTKKIKNTIRYYLMAIFICSALFGVSITAFAQGNGPFSELTEDHRQELRELLRSGDQEAFETLLKEYDVDVEALKDGRKRKGLGKDIAAQLTESQAQEVKEQIKTGATRNEVRETLEAFGVELPVRSVNNKNGEEIKAAIETGDYATFSELTEGTKLGERVDEKTFDAVSKARNLRDEGEYEEARKVIESIRSEENEGLFNRIFRKQKVNQDSSVGKVKPAKEKVRSGFFGRIFGA